MAIQLPQGFDIGSIEPIDKRIVLTKTQMYSINENVMPAHYFAICVDDNKIYVFDKNNAKISPTGKFREYTLSPESLSSGLPAALKIALESQEKDSGLEVDSEGNIRVKLNEEHLQIIDNKIDVAFSMIQAIESN